GMTKWAVEVNLLDDWLVGVGIRTTIWWTSLVARANSWERLKITRPSDDLLRSYLAGSEDKVLDDRVFGGQVPDPTPVGTCWPGTVIPLSPLLTNLADIALRHGLLTYDPLTRSREALHDELDRIMDAVDQAKASLAVKPPPATRGDASERHALWLATYQVLGRSFADIAKEAQARGEDAWPDAVRKAIPQYAFDIGLTIRPKHRR
ncbi:MAG: hypothetical protein FJZ01_27365, partial [Candidatus Sericytochromatia bacterium]|nr:hypothetical protein [Candidatus Tanganyikabacteria bacterium]